MATDEVPPPSDARWEPVPSDQLDIQILGKFAAMEQNKKHGWNLTFNTVYEAWKITLAENCGTLYLLDLKALRNSGLLNYQAIVWVLAEGYRDPTILMSFRELV